MVNKIQHQIHKLCSPESEQKGKVVNVDVHIQTLKSEWSREVKWSESHKRVLTMWPSE